MLQVEMYPSLATILGNAHISLSPSLWRTNCNPPQGCNGDKQIASRKLKAWARGPSRGILNISTCSRSRVHANTNTRTSAISKCGDVGAICISRRDNGRTCSCCACNRGRVSFSHDDLTRMTRHANDRSTHGFANSRSAPDYVANGVVE